MTIVRGTEGLMNCTIKNKGPTPADMDVSCSGLSDTGIGCTIDGKVLKTEKIQVKELSDKSFSVSIVSRSSTPIHAGTYPFTVSAVCANSGSCYK